MKGTPVRMALYEAQHGICCWCQEHTPIEEASIEHIKPVSKGGPRKGIRNMAMACKECNNLRGDMADWVFAGLMGVPVPTPPLQEFVRKKRTRKTAVDRPLTQADRIAKRANRLKAKRGRGCTMMRQDRVCSVAG